MNELLQEFISEARQQLEAVEACLLAMAGGSAGEVPACFRALHTIKGNAAFFALPRIQALAHTAEQLLDAMRDRRAPCDQERCDALLAAASRLGELIDGLAASGSEPPAEGATGAADGDAPLRARLATLARGPAADAPAASPAASSPAAPALAVPAQAPRTAADCLAALRGLAIGEVAAAVRLAGDLRRLAQAEGWSAAAMKGVDAISDEVDGLVLAAPGQVAAGFARLSARLGDLAPAVPAAPRTVDPQVLDDFIIESADLLTEAERPVLIGNGLDADGVAAVLRALHTLKGMASYLALPRLELLAHACEARLLPLRDGHRRADDGDRQLVLQAVEALRAVAFDIVLRRGDRGPLAATAVVLAAELGVAAAIAAAVPPAAADAGAIAQPAPPAERAQAGAPPPVAAAGPPPVAAALAAAQSPSRAGGDGTARVSTQRLDELMTLMGELLIAHSMVGQGGAAGAAAMSRQGRIIRDLQSLALGLRMVPLRGTCQKLARAVHDTARKLGKQVQFRMSGDDTELDRTLAEAVADPLLHMVRNAVDHGIEPAAARTAAGKPVPGTVTCAARQTADFVEIVLSDDGRGLDPGRLRDKAVEKGLIAADRQLSEAEAYDLIFLPGFTTADAVTEVSGRGVGMDVVRRNLALVDGRIDIRSAPGRGTTFTIRLPLTTAIIDAMLVGVGGERFLVPTGAVIELVSPRPGQVQSVLGGGRVIERRQRLLPVLALADLLGVERRAGTPPGAAAAAPGARTSWSARSSPGDAGNDPACAAAGTPPPGVLVVVNAGERALALEVDAAIGQQQVVVKPLDRRLGHAAGLAGSAILGDGRVGLIIDPARLVGAVQVAA